MGFKQKLDEAGERVGNAGLAVGQRAAAAGASASRAARDRGADLSERVDDVDPKETANSALWGLQAGSKVPGGPYSTALGTGLGAAYGAYSSVRENAVGAMEEGVVIEVEDEGEPLDRPPREEAMGASPGIDRRVNGILPGSVDVERASAMAVSSYDWYKRGHDKWGTKGGVAGAAFGAAQQLVMGGSEDETETE